MGKSWLAAKEPHDIHPYNFGHGTTVKAGIGIAKDGRMHHASSGKLRAGIYGFRITGDVDDHDVIAQVWERTRVGGYNGGCLIIFEADGIVVKRMATNETEVPPGAICNEGDQWCAGAGEC